MDGLGLATINSQKLFSTSTGLNFNFISTNVFESLNILDIWTVCKIDSSPDDVKMLLKNETNIVCNNQFCINKFSKILLILMETVLIELFYCSQKTCLAVRPKHSGDSLLIQKWYLQRPVEKVLNQMKSVQKTKGMPDHLFKKFSDTLTL